MAKIPENIRNYIIKRIDGNLFHDYLPKNKSLKILIRCSKCNLERQSKAFDIIHKKSTLCSSCSQKEKWKEEDFRNKSIKTRKTEGYRNQMRESVIKSELWKEKQPIRKKSLKKYWEKIRGYKFEDIEDVWYIYRKTVYKMSGKSYKKFRNLINPDNLPRGRNKYHLDHKFSVLEGFKNNIPLYIISHSSNLQMLKEKDNISKDFRCCITKEDLFKEVFGTWRLSYGY